MFQLTSILVLIIVGAASAVPYNFKNGDDNCVISHIEDVERVLKGCRNITIKSLSVPGEKTLALNLHPGTHLKFQGETVFEKHNGHGPLLQINGSSFNISGEGAVLNGRGHLYWDGKLEKGMTQPTFLNINATNATIDAINITNCPGQCVSINNSRQILLNKWNIDSTGDGHIRRISTGFEVAGSDNITVNNSIIHNEGDCVSVRSGKNYLFNNLTCLEGNGLALLVGINASDSQQNRAENITFSNCTVKNSLDGIHISTDTNVTNGYIQNVTYSNITLSGITNYGINVQEDYRAGHDSGKPKGNIPITGLKLEGIKGTMKSGQPVYILCGDNGCKDFNWSGVSIAGGDQKSNCNYHPNGYDC